MALYEITQDCRIANKEYQKWDVVSDTEVGWFYPTVMRPTNWQPKKVIKSNVVDLWAEENEAEMHVESEEKVEEKVEEKPAKKQRKRK